MARRRRRKMIWAPFGAGTVTLSASAVSAVDLTSLILTAMPSLSDYTLVRVRGVAGVRPTTTPDGLTRFYEMAMMMANSREFSSGGFADPEQDDASYLWFTTVPHTPMMVQERGGSSFDNSPSIVEIDAKAKRKADELERRLLFIIKNRQAVASDFFIEGRALLDLK